jgi:hypothetical protein
MAAVAVQAVLAIAVIVTTTLNVAMWAFRVRGAGVP